MTRRRLLALAVATMFLMTGCTIQIGSGPTAQSGTGTIQRPLSSGWLGPLPNVLSQMFIQLTQAGNHLQGTITEVSVTSNATLSTTEYPFTATLAGKAIAFRVQNASDPYWAGELQNSGQLALQFNTGDGPTVATLDQSSIAGLNSAEARVSGKSKWPG